MDERNNKIAALANICAYDSSATIYSEGAPHIKHYALRMLFSNIVAQVINSAKVHVQVPKVLDLGAGDGSTTLLLLKLGAKVTAIDISICQLNALRVKCVVYGDRINVRCGDISDLLINTNDKYDIIVANAFLHHIPDYINMISKAVNMLNPSGQFVTFQDPMRYDSIGIFDKLFSVTAYYAWRIFRGDVIGGMNRFLRRKRGVYIENSMHDNAEYHVIRDGVDQNAITQLLVDNNFKCNIVRYFSTQSRLFQPIGTALGLKNTFAVIARHK